MKTAIGTRWMLALLALGGSAVAAAPAAADGRAFQQAGDMRVDLAWAGDRDAPRAIALHVRTGAARTVARGLQRGGWAIPPAGPVVALRQLDGRGAPEATADLTTGGVRCCLRTHIVGWDADAGRHVRVVQDWGAGGYRVAHLDGDRRPELVSADDRLGFGVATPELVMPIRVWAYRAGALRDVTARHRRAVAADLNRAWVALGELRRRGGDPRAAIAAYLADARVLGRGAAARGHVVALYDGPAAARFVDRAGDRITALGYPGGAR